MRFNLANVLALIGFLVGWLEIEVIVVKIIPCTAHMTSFIKLTDVYHRWYSYLLLCRDTNIKDYAER